MSTLPPVPIAALPGADSALVQPLMEDFARRQASAGRRVAGVVQARLPDGGKGAIVLRNIATGALYPISQDLGKGSVACNLDTDGLASACAAVEEAARQGAELIVVSKFSKQEAGRGGLADAFRIAMAARIPIVTAVSPHYLDEWAAFAGPLAEFVTPDMAALERWWRNACPRHD